MAEVGHAGGTSSRSTSRSSTAGTTTPTRRTPRCGPPGGREGPDVRGHRNHRLHHRRPATAWSTSRESPSRRPPSRPRRQRGDLAGDIQSIAPSGPSTMSLGRLEQALAIEGAERRSAGPVQNHPPRIVFTPAHGGARARRRRAQSGRPCGDEARTGHQHAGAAPRDSAGISTSTSSTGSCGTDLAGPWVVATKLPSGRRGAQDAREEGARQSHGGPPRPADAREADAAAGTPRWSWRPPRPRSSPPMAPWIGAPRGDAAHLRLQHHGQRLPGPRGSAVYVLVTGRWFRRRL